nr:hypothetical protein [Stenotrophomonas geniculata]
MADPVNYCIWLAPSICATQSEWAAWAQAILSALAIWYSGRLAFNQKLLEKREKVETYVSILVEADFAAEMAIDTLSFAEIEEVSFVGPTLDFEGLQRSFQEISFHDVPDRRLVGIIRSAADCCRLLKLHHDDKMQGTPPADASDLIEATRAANRLSKCRSDAESIRDELLSFSLRIGARVRRSFSRRGR